MIVYTVTSVAITQQSPSLFYHTEPLPEGLAGTAHTLDRMAQLARAGAHDPAIRQLALDLVSGCRGHHFSCELKALHEFVRDEVTFRRDPVDREEVQEPAITIRTKIGDCDDKATLLAALLGAAGAKARFITIGRDTAHFSHVYVEAITPTGTVALDPTPEQAPAGWQASDAVRWAYEIWPKRAGGIGMGMGMIGWQPPDGLGFTFLPAGLTSIGSTVTRSVGSGIPWGSIIQQGIGTAPAIISAAKGQPYVSPFSTPIGQQRPGQLQVGASSPSGDSGFFGQLDYADVLKWGIIIVLGIVVFKKVLK